MEFMNLSRLVYWLIGEKIFSFEVSWKGKCKEKLYGNDRIFGYHEKNMRCLKMAKIMIWENKV